MKTTPKVFISVLVCLSVIGLAPAANAGFKDLALGHKNTQAIEFLQETGVVGGYTDGTFKPANRINRAELAKILVEAQGITPDATVYQNCFPDVKEEWFAPYVCYAKAAQWVNGYADGNFKPGQPVTKAEAVKMTINSQGFDTETATCNKEFFKDAEEDQWYGKFLCIALGKGLLEEDANGNYVPAGEITRAQVSENIYRAIAVRKLNKAAYTEEVAGMVDEAKTEFKTEREAIKAEIEDFKTELEQLKTDGATAEEIKNEREDFWEGVKEAQENNRETFVEKIKEANELFKQEKEQLKEERQACRDQDLVYSSTDDDCVEKSIETEDAEDEDSTKNEVEDETETETETETGNGANS
jgi:hypothetical protein